MQHCFIQFDSTLPESRWARCPGAPRMMLRCDAPYKRTILTDENGIKREWGNPIEALHWLSTDARHEDWIGWISYDLGRWLERIPSRAQDDLQLPLFIFTTHDSQTTKSLRSTAESAISPVLTSTFTRNAYESCVQKCIDYIAAGDVFQINLSQRFTSELTQSPLSIYQSLCSSTPAAYGAYLEYVDFVLICNSPELFLRVTPDRRVITRPIKGTRPRLPGMESELRSSPKDQAELNMIVDLERNDLGRVCEIGSVKVTEPRAIEAHPTVYHGVATIEGILRKDVSFTDLLRAVFPGGSITGAPKIRAMEIIEELEPLRRGAYCGAIGYLDRDGTIEFNVAIRTMIVKNGSIHIPVGGGIVADSDPKAEYEETLVKAKAMFAAVGISMNANVIPAFHLRPATVADAEAIRAVHVESIRINCANDYTQKQIEAWAGPKQAQHYIDGMNRSEFMFVAESDGQLVGFAALAGDEMRALYVSPKHLRKGIGKALLRAIEAKAARRGVTMLKLESTITAQKFYESQGFRPGASKVHVMNGVEIPCMEMTKNINPAVTPANCDAST